MSRLIPRFSVAKEGLFQFTIFILLLAFFHPVLVEVHDRFLGDRHAHHFHSCFKRDDARLDVVFFCLRTRFECNEEYEEQQERDWVLHWFSFEACNDIVWRHYVAVPAVHRSDNTLILPSTSFSPIAFR